MARVKYQKARKGYPAAGIKKGDMYYYTRIKTGPRSSRQIRQLTPIRPSQMTTSSFLSQFYELQERLDDFTGPIDGMEEFLNELAEAARELGQEEQEKFDNMPEQLQGGDTGVMLEERAQAMNAWAESLESAASTAADKASEFEENQSAWETYDLAVAEYDPEKDPDATEPEEPGEDRMEEEALVEEIKGEIEEPEV